MGAMQEIVTDRVTGVHFIPGDPEDLAAKVRWVNDHPYEAVRMGRNARKEFESKYNAMLNYQLLLDIYQTAIERNG